MTTLHNTADIQIERIDDNKGSMRNLRRAMDQVQLDLDAARDSLMQAQREVDALHNLIEEEF